MNRWNSWDKNANSSNNGPLEIEESGENVEENTVRKSNNSGIRPRSASRSSSSSITNIVRHLNRATPRPNSWEVEGELQVGTKTSIQNPTQTAAPITTVFKPIAFRSPIKTKKMNIQPPKVVGVSPQQSASRSLFSTLSQNGGRRTKKARRTRKAKNARKVTKSRKVTRSRKAKNQRQRQS